MPATTRVSHYLRTGRLLPEEQFTGFKSQHLTVGDDDFLSHKSWSTRDFWNHYKRGRGRAVDLRNVGLLDRFRNSRSVRKAVSDFRKRQTDIAKQKAVEIYRKVHGGGTGEDPLNRSELNDLLRKAY